MKKNPNIMRFILFCLTAFNVFYSHGQSISGKAVDINNEPLIYSNIVLYRDTILISGIVSNNGNFSFDNLKKGDYLICVSCFGFKDSCVHVQCEDLRQDIVISLRNKDTELDEIVVKENRPEISIEDNKMILPVKNSVLTEQDNINEVLKFLPGVITTSKGIEVFGKGKPLFLINDKEVLNFSEIESISPADIEKVEISYGSSKFDASVQCIINIITQKKHDSVGARVYTRAELVDDKFRSISEFRINYDKNKLHHYLFYSDTNGKLISKEGSDMNISLSSGNTYRSSFDAEALNNADYNYLLYKFEYNLDTTQNIGLQLNGSLDNPVNDIKINSLINLENQYFTLQKDKHKNIDFQTTLFYDFNIQKKAKLSVLLDYYLLKKRQNVDIYENTYYQMENSSDYSVSAAKADYSFPVSFLGAELTIGSKYYITNNLIDNIFFEAVNPLQINENFTAQNKLKENCLAFYTDLKKSFGDKIKIEAGVRYENYVRNIEIITDDTLIIRNNNYFFPSVSLSYLPAEYLQIMMGYSKHINRQAYDYISGQNIYANPYLYKAGNPLLNPEIYDSYSANLVLFGGAIAFQAAYLNRKDYTALEITSTDSVLQISYANYKKHEWNLGLNLGSNIATGWVSIGINVNKPDFEYEYMGNTVSENHFNYNFNADFSFDFLKTFSVSNYFQYTPESYFDMLHFKPYLQNQMILIKYFLNKQFRISFSYTYQYRQEFSSGYKQLNMTNYTENGRNKFTLSLRYDFNFKNRKQKTSGIDEELHRINTN